MPCLHKSGNISRYCCCCSLETDFLSRHCKLCVKHVFKLSNYDEASSDEWLVAASRSLFGRPECPRLFATSRAILRPSANWPEARAPRPQLVVPAAVAEREQPTAPRRRQQLSSSAPATAFRPAPLLLRRRQATRGAHARLREHCQPREIELMLMIRNKWLPFYPSNTITIKYSITSTNQYTATWFDDDDTKHNRQQRRRLRQRLVAVCCCFGYGR